MYRLFILLGIYFLCQVNGLAQEKFEIRWLNDTAWYVNPNYDPNYDKEYKPEITFPALDDEYSHYRIDWGIPGASGDEVTDPSLAFTAYPEYPGEGIYNLVISLFKTGNATDVPDEVVHKKIMNRRLEASFRLEPENSRRCMEWGGDSILLVLTEHNNPQETRYEIQVSSEVEKTMSSNDSLFRADWINADSAWIIMKEPTGIFEARVYVRMSWKMHGVTITDKTYKLQTFNAYHAPDIRDIFDFADTLANGERLENFTICTDKDQIQSYIQLDSMRLGKYQYHASTDLPYYHSVNDRQDMEIRYFWTDEKPDEHTVWEEVTGRYDFVDTTDLIHFKKAGYYKLRIEAHNRCNYDPDDPDGALLHLDSLWTDSVRGVTGKRYFQVFERATDNIICRKDSVCMVANHIILVDRNVRKSYDHAPEYKVTIEGLEKDRDYVQYLSIYKGGYVVDGRDGCDSTEIHLIIQKTGNYNIQLVRKSDPCDPVEKSFKVYIGERPQVTSNTLLADQLTGLGATLLEDGQTYQKCDSFRYILPQDCWINNNFDLDSAIFYMSKGSRKDTILNNQLTGTDVAFYDFDSTGNTINYIRLRAHNYCGWSEELSIDFYTRTKPDPVIWRDSLADNDSLCINFDYPYYWGGVLPEKYTVTFSFLGSGRAVVNGSYLGAGDEKKIQGWPVANKFKYTAKGQKTEDYMISNDDMPACYSTFSSVMYVIDAPDEILYDTVRYCPTLTVLETERLFDAGHKVFKYAEWKWNKGTTSTDLFPHFSLMQTTDDTLCYKLSNSKGCFRADRVIVRPDELPVLELKADGRIYCLPDTIRDFVGAPYMDQLTTATGFDYAVYRESVDPSRLQCSSATGICQPLPLTGKPENYALVYVVENNRVDTAFAAGCRLEKTVDLKLYSPRMEILKADTVPYPWGSYDFNALTGYVDTAKLNPLTLKWTPVNGTGTLVTSNEGDKLFGINYTLSAADQSLDTLLFELSGQSICGNALQDTLVLVIAHIEMRGYKDTICENSTYSLWPRMESRFVDESSVEWEVCYPTDPAIQGTLFPVSGVAVTYTPAAGIDSVRIAVKGTLEGYPLQQVKDTVVLLVNPMPVVNLLQGDTLLARNNEVNVRHIAGEWLAVGNVNAVFNGRTLAYNDGRWIGDTVYKFTSPVEGDPKKYVTSEIRFEGLAGCAAVTQKMTFVNLTFADFRFRHEQLQICAGDVLKLDTLYEKNGSFDRYTTLVWEAESAGVKGNFTPVASSAEYYESATPVDKVNKLRLKTSKTYTAYDGILCENKLLVNHAVSLVVHEHPVLNWRDGSRKDTLCREDDRLLIVRDRIQVFPARYEDSLQLNGSPFRADLDYRTLAAPGESDTLVFTVSQGGCTRWNESDSLFIYRLPHMITGTFSVAPVCEMGSVAITPGPGNLVHPLAAGMSWDSSGGNLNTEDIPVFTPLPGAERGSITLHVQPPHGCPEDTLRREMDIYSMPELILPEDTVCRISGQKVNIQVNRVTTGNYSGLDKIDWFRKGESVSWKTTAEVTSVEYEITTQDSVAGFVEIVAQAWANGICSGLCVYDTVRITLQDPPKVILPAAGIPDLCQTASLNLGDFVGFDAVSDIAWSLKTPGTGSLSGALYAPGEYFGPTVIQTHVKGLHACPEVTREIALNVIYTPEPQIEVLSETTCQSDTISFQASAPVTATWQWETGDGNGFAGQQVKYRYAEAGRYTVGLTAHYGICTRKKEIFLEVHEKPKAIFYAEQEVALGQPISFSSESLPEDVLCEWVFEDGKTIGSSCTHTFTGPTGERKVELWVKTEHGCVDSVSHILLAVDVPVPDFELHVNPCNGEVEITNHSSRHHAEAEWDFGNGSPVSSVWDPLPLVYERTYQDTVYYITLTLKNAAGAPALRKEVKLVSKLEAGVEVMPATDGCNKLEKEVHIVNRGVADSVRIWWGDGSYECWGGDQQVVMRRHRYTNEGTEVEYFPLRLAAENSCKKDTTSPVAVAVYPLSVKAKLIADPAYTNECFGNERGFQNKSFGFVPDGYSCEWQFEPDRSVVSHPEPDITWLYERPGEYMVRLRVRDNCNEDTDSLRIIVHGNDSLDFEFAPGPYCSEKEISMNFVAHGKEEFGDFRWTFPDGRTRQGRQAEYAFPAGEQWIELSAKADGCPSLVRHRLMVHESPVPLVRAEDDITTACQPFEVRLYGRNAAEQEATTWWDFKDGTYSDQADILKTFDEPGVYPVSFRLETTEGCVDSAVIPVTVLYTPEISVNWNEKLFCTVDGNFEVEGINTSADLADCSFEWWQGTQLVSLQPDKVHLSFRDIFGKTEVRLKGVHKQSRCAVEISDTIVSSPGVEAVLQIHPVAICEGAPVIFKNISVGGKYTSIDLGDGYSTAEQEFEHVYETSGQYPVKLRVENADGCRDSIEQWIDVHPLPVADFSWSKDHRITGLPDSLKLPEKANGGVGFINHSSYTDLQGRPGEMVYQWNFGDSTAISSEASPTHVFPNNGLYEVWLYIETASACRDSISEVVNIDAVKGLYFPNAFAPGTEDEGVNRFQPKGVGLYRYSVRIYDERGICVWSSDRLKDGKPGEYWDGTFKGQPLPKGIYTWHAEAVFIDGTVYEKDGGSGFVILIR